MNAPRRFMSQSGQGLGKPHVVQLGSRMAEEEKLHGLHEPLAVAVAQAHKLWPAIVVETAAFAQFVHERLPEPREATLALNGERGPDLVLAFACAQSDAHALAALEQRYDGHIDAILAGLIQQRLARDEAKQAWRQHLLLKRGTEPPRIAKYGGRGSLLAFVRAVALRVALDLLRARREPGADDGMDELPDGSPDPLHQYTTKLYSSECKQAFAAALQSLKPKDRTILRYHVVDQLSIDQIGRIYQVHRATAARWVTRARDTMIQGTRKALMAGLQVDQDELESILRQVGTDLDVSAERLLRITQLDP